MFPIEHLPYHPQISWLRDYEREKDCARATVFLKVSSSSVVTILCLEALEQKNKPKPNQKNQPNNTQPNHPTKQTENLKRSKSKHLLSKR